VTTGGPNTVLDICLIFHLSLKTTEEVPSLDYIRARVFVKDRRRSTIRNEPSYLADSDFWNAEDQRTVGAYGPYLTLESPWLRWFSVRTSFLREKRDRKDEPSPRTTAIKINVDNPAAILCGV
jgi:hypothetical protein